MDLHKNIPVFYAKSRKEWRKWLQQNHEMESKVWLIVYHKNAVTPGVKYAEFVEEGLCFGWINSLANKRDGESYFQYFSKHNPKSNWSKSNRERVAELTKKGIMTPAGQAMVDLAKEKGTWISGE